MTFGDYSAPAVPSLDQQRDALQKGLGRAMQWALSGHLDDGPLLWACRETQVFDTQCEGPRGEWLWRLVQTVGAVERFREPILHALHELADERSAIQLCELAKMYAIAGDSAFRIRLYEIVEQKPFSIIPWLGEKELIEMDGGQGMVSAARVRGRGLATRDWEWDDRSFIEDAVKQLGQAQVHELLEANLDEEVGRFWKSWRLEIKKKAEKSPVRSREQQMRAITVSEIISAAESEGPRFAYFRGWGKYADSGDVRAVLQRLWAAKNSKVIVNYLTIFSNRALPEFDARLIEFCRHPDEKVQMRAFQALSKNSSPVLRSFALAEIKKGLTDGSIASLFVNNYQPGDEEQILDALVFPEDENEQHWLLMDIGKVLENNPNADASKLALVIYGCTPCENCRFTALKLLERQHAIPPWMMERMHV